MREGKGDIRCEKERIETMKWEWEKARK